MRRYFFMQTDKIKLLSGEDGREAALKQAEKFSEYVGLSKKDAARLRLLTEETFGMVNTITGDFSAQFYIESAGEGAYKIHLIAKTNMDQAKKQELIQASSNKKNAAGRGFMGKIRDIIENGLYSVDEVGELQTRYGGGTVMYGAMGMIDPEALNAGSLAYAWSLEQYRQSVGDEMKEKEELSEAWDELEKSIVASIADNVSVSVKGETVEMIIEKRNG